MSIIDLTREHSDEYECEDKGSDGKYEHEYALHKPCHYALSWFSYFGHLSISIFYVFILNIADIFDDFLILAELGLETLGKLFHTMHHL